MKYSMNNFGKPFSPSESTDVCDLLLDFGVFGQCLPIVDPSLFVEWCRKDTCYGKPEAACAAIGAYASECASAGFCVEWRTDLCPKPCPTDQVYQACGSKCPMTCENLEKDEVAPSCGGFTEGCFCTEGHVLRNGTCVEPKDCLVCDEEGHHSGDVWKKDKCTKCTCKGTLLKCEKQTCPEKICDKGYKVIKVPTKDDECCQKYTCGLEEKDCEPPQQLLCGNNQITKLDRKPNGCQQFICECKPKSDCSPVEIGQQQLEDGYVEEIDDQGCCPEIKSVCKPETCEPPADCPQFHTLKQTPGKCCPLYSCEPPKSQCIYENIYNELVGGGRFRRSAKSSLVLKNANETWKDGPCRECKCLLTDVGNYQSSCTNINCPGVELSQDYFEYELDSEFVEGQCCPNYKRVACKWNGKVHQINEKWPNNKDPCTSYKCVNHTGVVEKQVEVTDCDEKCELGSEYVKSKSADVCCGSCKPYACVVDGVLHKTGQEWFSVDFCKKYFCLDVNESLQIESVVENCPELPSDYEKNYIFDSITIPGQCCKDNKVLACKHNNMTISINETLRDPHDKCKEITCSSKDGHVIKKESTENCNKECLIGWEYRESDGSKCCGDCVQIGCVVNGMVKKPAEQWRTPDNNCTTFACEKLGEQFVVSSQQESCPSLDNCPKANIYKKGCCQYCNSTASAQTLCAAIPLSAKKTIGIIKAFQVTHGHCQNKKSIPSLNECVGSCQSSTFFNLVSGSHENVCSCCRAVDYQTVPIELECEDGYKWTKQLSVPSSCSCESCGNSKP